MLKKAVAVVAVAASVGIVSVGPSLAANESSPWYDMNSNAAQSRANLTEKALTPLTVAHVKYLRSVFSPPARPQSPCPLSGIVSPVLVGGDLYVLTGGQLSKYNAATGSLIWRRSPDPAFDTVYKSLAVSSGLVIVGGSDCESASEPAGTIFAFNTSTGAPVWSSEPHGAGPLSQAVVASSYVVTAGVDAAGYTASVLNVSTGKHVWGYSNSCFPPSDLPMVDGLLVMSYGCDSQGNVRLEAHKLATGALVWSHPGAWKLQRGDLSGSAGKNLYVTNPSGAVADLHPLTGQVKYTLSNHAANVLAVDASRVYATCGSQALSLCAYHITTGALAYQVGTPENPVFVSAIAAEAGGVLYLDSGQALNAATGKVIRNIWNVNSPAATALAVGDGRIAEVSDPRVLDLYGLQGY